jgi:anti-repressor protein
VKAGVTSKPMTVYYVDERDSHVVVARLSPAYTAFLVDFWMPACWRMTNRKPQFSLPQTMAEALKLAADQAENLAHSIFRGLDLI